MTPAPTLRRCPCGSALYTQHLRCRKCGGGRQSLKPDTRPVLVPYALLGSVLWL
jgi:hypothetical protein